VASHKQRLAGCLTNIKLLDWPGNNVEVTIKNMYNAVVFLYACANRTELLS
jgi:hypothetical protein